MIGAFAYTEIHIMQGVDLALDRDRLRIMTSFLITR
jgi:hypothetical protein